MFNFHSLIDVDLDILGSILSMSSPELPNTRFQVTKNSKKNWCFNVNYLPSFWKLFD